MLRVGRLKESVFKRSVMKQLHNEKTSAPFCAHSMTVEGWTLAADRILSNMVNTFSVRRCDLSQLSVSVSMPEDTEEPEFRAFTSRLGKLCGEYGIWLNVDDVQVKPSVAAPIIVATGMGQRHEEEQKIEADMDILVAGTIACEGAAVLACEHEEELRERFAGFYVDIAKHLFDTAAMPAVRYILMESVGTAVREGGIFAGLWEMAAAHKVGLDIDLSAIPIQQHTIEVCEFFNLNPYMLQSGGCLLIAARHGDAMVSALEKEGITAAVVGRTCAGNDRIIRYDDEIRFLEPPKTDEIYKVIK